jgi:hypothetical protein
MATRKRTELADSSIRAATIVRIAAYDATAADTIVQPDGLRVPTSHPRTGEGLTREERAILVEVQHVVADAVEAAMRARPDLMTMLASAAGRLAALPASARSTDPA